MNRIRIPTLLFAASMLLQCRTQGARVSLAPNIETERMDDDAQNSMQSALLLGNNESILGVSPKQADHASQKISLALADTKSENRLTEDDALLVAASVMAAVDDGMTSDGGDTFDYLKDAKYHPGGPLAYLTSLAPETYFKIFKWKNEFMVKNGWQTPYHKVSGGSEDRFKYKQNYLGADITLENKPPFVFNPQGINLKGKELNLFLGILPSEDIVNIIRADPRYTDQSLSKILNGSGTLKVISALEEHEIGSVASGLNKKQLNVPDNQPVSIPEIFVGVGYIDSGLNDGENIYIHCKSGVGRSATLVAAWYIKHYNMSAADAAAFVKERRPEVAIGREGHYHQQALEDFEIVWKIKRGEDVSQLYSDYKIDERRKLKIQRGIRE